MAMQPLEHFNTEDSEQITQNRDPIPVHKQMVFMFFQEKKLHTPDENVIDAMFRIMNHYANTSSFNYRNSSGVKGGIIAQAIHEYDIPLEQFYLATTGENLYATEKIEYTNIDAKMSQLERTIKEFVESKLGTATT